jgi:outer membrane receptor protein involved in Fe transport
LDYHLGDALKVNLGSTFVAKHYADDTHTPNRFIPSYKVWDLTTEWSVKPAFKIFAGINNLFDENYYARITGTGIDPAARRNYYGGATVKF